MSRIFDESLQDILQSMLSVCLEYANGSVDAVYLYCSAEHGMLTADVFYEIDGNFHQTHELNKSVSGIGAPRFDTSEERGYALLECLVEDLRELIILHERNDLDSPTELKAHYDVTAAELTVSYDYELKYSHTETLMASDIFEAWFEQIKGQPSRAD